MSTDPAPVRSGRFPWLVYWIIFVVLLAFTIWPIVSVIVAGSIAESHGCQLDEGSVHPCIVDGSDWGETLSTLAVLGWFMLATLPLGGGALLVWLIIVIIHHINWSNRQRRV